MITFHMAQACSNISGLKVPQKLLLFGPFGFGKTTLVKNIASSGGYHLVKIDPTIWYRMAEEEASPSTSILREALGSAPSISTCPI